MAYALHVIATLAGLAIIGLMLWDAFEVILVPRRVTNAFRVSRVVVVGLWRMWKRPALRIGSRREREGLLSPFAMLTVLLLFGTWVLGQILGFSLLHWGMSSHLRHEGLPGGFIADLYLSGSTFFTLGLGDVAPVSGLARVLTVIEGGMGFGFLALIIAYLPVLYQAFSRRETRISMLDEWAGSPPSATVLLRRPAEQGEPLALVPLLREWELASAEILESHVSYAILGYFRSQHDNQSWVAAITTVLDACTLVIAGIEDVPTLQARQTFAMARHAVVDLCQVYRQRPIRIGPDRLPSETLEKVRRVLVTAGLKPYEGAPATHQVHMLREMYEPYVRALSEHLLMPLPGWLPPERAKFNWETTAWATTGRDHAH